MMFCEELIFILESISLGFPIFWQVEGLDLCLRHLSCGRSGAAEDSLQVQWYSEDVTHRHIGMVSHGSCIAVIDAGAWMCHFLNVAMGRSVSFAVHLQVLPTGDVFIVCRLRIQLTLRRMQLLTRNPTVASLISMLLSVYALNESLLPLLRSWCCSSWYSRTNAGSPQYQGGRLGQQNGKRQRSQQFAPRIMNHWCERSQNWSPSTVLTWSGSKLENRGKFNIQSIAAYGISWTLNFQKISRAHLKGSFCWWSAGRQWCNRSGRAESGKKPPLARLLPWIIHLSLFNHFFL